MSRLVLCSVFDSKVGAFMRPFVCLSKGEAIRSFQDACGDDTIPFKKHPADFQLFLVGEFDDQSGTVLGLPVAERLIGADEF